MAEHELKTWTTVYPDIAEGLKSFDIRPNDRDFDVDDVLVLREYDPILGTYTGRSCVRRVTYVLAGGFGLRDGYVAMGVERCGQCDASTNCLAREHVTSCQSNPETSIGGVPDVRY